MTPCIIHPSGISKAHGYGIVYIERWPYRAHRVAYCKAKGVSLEDIKDVHIRHKCDNKACVNPEHLEPGTPADNMADKVSRGRQAKGETHTIAKLTAAQVAYIRSVHIPRDKQFSARALARSLGVCESTVNKIISGKNWRLS